MTKRNNYDIYGQTLNRKAFSNIIRSPHYTLEFIRPGIPGKSRRRSSPEEII
jgi:hypothetical protein